MRYPGGKCSKKGHRRMGVRIIRTSSKPLSVITMTSNGLIVLMSGFWMSFQSIILLLAPTEAREMQIFVHLFDKNLALLAYLLLRTVGA